MQNRHLLTFVFFELQVNVLVIVYVTTVQLIHKMPVVVLIFQMVWNGYQVTTKVIVLFATDGSNLGGPDHG